MKNEPVPLLVLDYHCNWFDQDKPLAAILHAAFGYKARGFTRFWVLLPGYSVTSNTGLAARRVPHGQSAAFKVEPSPNLGERQTLYYEHYLEHGGLYLLDIEDFLERQVGIEVIGQTCHTVDEVMAARNFKTQAVVLTTLEELEAPGLTKVFHERNKALSYVGVQPKYSQAAPEINTIAKHHEYLFAAYRSDLLVFDADFLPTAEPRVLMAACNTVIDNTNNAYVHLFHARNPVNGLVYGHGAPKIFPRRAQLLRRQSNLQNDFTLGVGAGIVIHKVCLGDHVFNWSAYSAWRTAAKECAKLALAAEKKDDEALHRLQVWCSPGDTTAPFHDECLSGARFSSRNPNEVLASKDLKELFATSV